MLSLRFMARAWPLHRHQNLLLARCQAMAEAATFEVDDRADGNILDEAHDCVVPVLPFSTDKRPA